MIRFLRLRRFRVVNPSKNLCGLNFLDFQYEFNHYLQKKSKKYYD
jgi:hypothetical protein